MAETAGWTNGLTYVAGGRIYDDSQDDPYWFYYPSLNVNANGETWSLVFQDLARWSSNIPIGKIPWF